MRADDFFMFSFVQDAEPMRQFLLVASDAPVPLYLAIGSVIECLQGRGCITHSPCRAVLPATEEILVPGQTLRIAQTSTVYVRALENPSVKLRIHEPEGSLGASELVAPVSDRLYIALSGIFSKLYVQLLKLWREGRMDAFRNYAQAQVAFAFECLSSWQR